jgi:hypothetical protein
MLKKEVLSHSCNLSRLEGHLLAPVQPGVTEETMFFGKQGSEMNQLFWQQCNCLDLLIRSYFLRCFPG